MSADPKPTDNGRQPRQEPEPKQPQHGGTTHDDGVTTWPAPWQR